MLGEMQRLTLRAPDDARLRDKKTPMAHISSKIAIEIVDFPIKNGDFPWQNVSSPEGILHVLHRPWMKSKVPHAIPQVARALLGENAQRGTQVVLHHFWGR